MADPVLAVRGLGKAFGGLVANDAINLDIAAGEIHAVIGPNGAGKSTLLAMLAGELRPDRGRIFLHGRDITRLPTHRRARAGIGRVFQITSILPSFSAHENIAIAGQLHRRRRWQNWWRRADHDAALNTLAQDLLDNVGLAGRASVPAGELSHGEHRQLEIAMALAGNASLLLLDEPSSGMGVAESRQLIRLLRPIAAGRAVLLVEHDMAVVFALADRVTVLADGQMVASGSPAMMRENAAVRRLYLGALADG